MSVSVQHLKQFLHFAAKELGIKVMPKVRFTGSSENKMSAFGHSVGNKIVVRITDRHPIDVMRTIVHELIHFKQNLHKVAKSERIREDEANALAGRIMRKFDTTYPHVFNDKPIKSVNEDGEGMTTSALAANRTGPGIANIDPIMTLKAPLKRKQVNQPWDYQLKYNSPKYNYVLPDNQPKKLRDIIGRDFKNERRSDKR